MPSSINAGIAADDRGIERLRFDARSHQRLTHYVFRFPAKFHAPVVKRILESHTAPGDLVVDPFCGSGTLLVEAAAAERHAIGIDVDPLSVFLARTKAQQHDQADLEAAAETLIERLSACERTGDEYAHRMHIDLTDDEYRSELVRAAIPAIPNLNHWFRRYVIVDLARLRDAIDAIPARAPVRAALRLVFASIIRASSNADPVPVSGLERTSHMIARDEKGRLVNPFDLFRRKLRRSLSDYAEFQEVRCASSTTSARRADATARLPLRNGEVVDAVVTSPPYHGAVDYYRRHQLEMFWLGLTATQNDRLRLLAQYLGRPHVPQSHPFVEKATLTSWPNALQSERDIRAHAPRRADEFRHYCVGMSRALQRIATVLRAGAPAVFVVGHSTWNDAELSTTDLFGELAGGLFEVDSHLWYPVQNRHMSYGRRNGANIDREYVLVLRRRRT